MDHQDWKPVILKKPVTKQSKPKELVVKNNINSNNNFAGTGKKINDDDEITPLPTVGITIGKQIAQARTAKKISQKELANKMNVPLQTIQQNENGKALRNNSLLSNS